ncbi:MAG: hypothetical protein JWQ49_5770 [Edaphobacter sp.]|nr:hypothetical protein [Edaphobacter sp.]
MVLPYHLTTGNALTEEPLIHVPGTMVGDTEVTPVNHGGSWLEDGITFERVAARIGYA